MYIVEDLLNGGTWIFEDAEKLNAFVSEQPINAEFSIKRATLSECIERGYEA